MKPDLDNLPKTITVTRAGQGHPYIPEDFPVVTILDQQKLPGSVEYLHITDWREMIECIKHLKIRGAPAIGIAGACAVMLRAAEYAYSASNDSRGDALDFDRVFVIDEQDFDPALYELGMDYAAKMIVAARPTAVNLSFAVDGCMEYVRSAIGKNADPGEIEDGLFEHVISLIGEDERINRAIGRNGSALLSKNARIITHCNAGSLATAFYGTALGVIYSAAEDGGIEMVYADETRPVCQGLRLTSWELSRAAIPVTLICDSMSAYVMANNHIDAVIVGADRIASNGDVANKIGTLGLAIAASHFSIPFYVAAPTSTIDPRTPSGGEIEIEQRASSEIMNEPMDGVDVLNPAFDVTPCSLIRSIITENGVYSPKSIMDALA